jgi:hypothetical protein
MFTTTTIREKVRDGIIERKRERERGRKKERER